MAGGRDNDSDSYDPTIHDCDCPCRRWAIKEVERLRAEHAEQLAALIQAHNAELTVRYEERYAAERERDEAREAALSHDVSHPGPCCVREVLRVDIKGRALTGGRKK